jgi:hypothetical protein
MGQERAGMMVATAIGSGVLAESTTSQVSSILHAIAPLFWPIVVLLAIIIFRAPLTGLIGRISEVDVGSAKVLAQTDANNAANTAKAVAMKEAGKAQLPPKPPKITDAEANASKDPSGSIMTAWLAVEDAARGAGNPAGHGVVSPSVPAIVNELTSKGLDSSLVPVAKSLESLRNVAASKPKAVNAATATSFVSAAGDLARLISKIGKEV